MRSLLSLFHLYSVFGQHLLRSAPEVRAYTSIHKFFSLHHFDNQCKMLPKDLSNWQFAPSTLTTLPVDDIKENFVRRNVRNAVFSEVTPTPLKTDIKLVDYSEDVLTNILDLDPSVTKTQDFVEFIAGNKILNSSKPLAHRYGGYQFGSWAMQLGDGRAILLGEYVNKKGESWELQLKGAGKTPYSRDGDGRAVLRSSIREFLASEAMHHLGIPTSRAAAIVVSDDEVIRDPLYNGYARKERTAVVLRVAQTWFRFGSLEILMKTGDLLLLKQLTDFIIKQYFPEIHETDEDKYILFFSTVVEKTMNLVLAWQSIGFAHGVLNTDNMSILGLTIDYGPFGFCEAYKPDISPNYSDREGRYCYNNQLAVVAWNLEKLSFALVPLITDSQRHQIHQIINSIKNYAKDKLTNTFCTKLGLQKTHSSDSKMLNILFDIMEENGADFTMTFRQLGEISPDDLMKKEVLERPEFWSLHRFHDKEQYAEFVDMYQQRVELEEITEEERRRRMNTVNPRYILRNWMAESAIQKAENNDFSEVHFIQEVLKHPYTFNEEAEKAGYSGPPPDWADNLKVSCSS